MTQREIKSQANVHPITISAGDVKPQSEQQMSRRGFGGLALFGVMSVALAACGGGSSDPTGVTDSNSSSNGPKNLRAKYDALSTGMNKSDVKALVGMEPNDGESEGLLWWVNSSESLRVDFSAGGSELISGARYISGSTDIYKGLGS